MTSTRFLLRWSALEQASTTISDSIATPVNTHLTNSNRSWRKPSRFGWPDPTHPTRSDLMASKHARSDRLRACQKNGHGKNSLGKNSIGKNSVGLNVLRCHPCATSSTIEHARFPRVSASCLQLNKLNMIKYYRSPRWISCATISFAVPTRMASFFRPSGYWPLSSSTEWPLFVFSAGSGRPKFFVGATYMSRASNFVLHGLEACGEADRPGRME